MPIIWITNEWQRFIQYDETELMSSNTEFFTIKQLTIEEIEEIENATFIEVQKILANYL